MNETSKIDEMRSEIFKIVTKKSFLITSIDSYYFGIGVLVNYIQQKTTKQTVDFFLHCKTEGDLINETNNLVNQYGYRYKDDSLFRISLLAKAINSYAKNRNQNYIIKVENKSIFMIGIRSENVLYKRKERKGTIEK